jgi:hypothetical protein
MTADCEHQEVRSKGDFIEEDYNIIRGAKRRAGIAERTKVEAIDTGGGKPEPSIKGETGDRMIGWGLR